jgi:NAD(P)-dependent dehydrogenase (short-subunit alcohol dehydrogenase family)
MREAVVAELDVSNLFSVAGKTVVVTGGVGGIGRMLSSGFAAAGARVYITGRKADALADAVRALSATGAEVTGVHADLATAEGTATVVRELTSRESRVHVLVNNAGQTWGAPLAEFPSSAWASVLGVNLQAPFALAQGLLPLLGAAASEEDPARIINIGSVVATRTEVMNAYSYAASKAALHQLTRVLAKELAPQRILVNAIAPGFFPSRMTGFVLRNDAAREALLGQIPLGRAGRPEDIAGLALYLCSRAGSYVTGAIIPVDGGLLVAH